jgi:hypothetical protein
MERWTQTLFSLVLLFAANPICGWSQGPHIDISSTLAPPEWALLERALLDANEDACREFFGRYFDERGFLLCVERWGGDDGPDDAIENCNDWPILHAVGASDEILAMYKKAWEGHLRQYTLARTTDVPFARDGMYYKEFPVTFDWVHNGEGLTVFNLQGLSDPEDIALGKRIRRFAGFYMNDDAGAPNYDPEHKIIRSMFNGSRGPLLRKATGLDWAGDPIEVKGRFSLGHGEETYEQMVFHFKDYNDIVGDHPQNLLATSLAVNAFMLTGEQRYRDWVLEYAGAWRQRMEDNGFIIPTNIGLDGTPGGEADGKWYGGVYGWNFSVEVPQDGSIAHRNTHYLGFTGFMNAYMLTGDDKFLECWRRQIEKINQQGKVIDGRMQYPRMYGDDGWYNYSPSPYNAGAMEIYYLSMREEDAIRVSGDSWLSYLAGKNPGYPVAVLRGDLERIRSRVSGMREDTTTPDTRLADDPMKFNPASVSSLIQLMLGGIHPGHRGSVLHCRLRFFDHLRRRAGLPADVAVLVDSLGSDQCAFTIVNTNQTAARELTVQAGGYGEHRFGVVKVNGDVHPVQGKSFRVTLAAGAGARLEVDMSRFVNAPRLDFPWKREN